MTTHSVHHETGAPLRTRAALHRQQARQRFIIRSTALAAAAVLIAGAGADVARSHTLTHVEVDGVTRPVSAWGNTVEAALLAANVTVRTGDEVTPALGSRIKDGQTVSVRRARPVAVNIAGRDTELDTTATTVSDVLRELGRTDAQISASRSSAREDLAMVAQAGEPVTVVADGKRVQTELADRFNAAQTLAAAKVEVSPIDRVHWTVGEDGGLEIKVERVERGTVTSEREVPYKRIEKPDDNLVKGTQKVETEGKNGLEKVQTYRQSVDGKLLVNTEVSTQTVTAPVDEVVRVGTVDPQEMAQRAQREGLLLDADGNPIPSEYTGADPRAMAQAQVAERGWSADQFQCLLTLWNRESGWNPYARNASSGAYGIPQALPGSKMATAGADWQTNPATQIRWGLGYIAGRYQNPCGALAHSDAMGWY